jgi:curved DNA-binding protein CbpA
LLDVVETHNIWGIQSPPEDWQTGLGEPTAAQRLGHILGCEWAARFKSISKVAAPPTGFAMGRESQPKPAPASLKPEVPPSSSEKGSGEGPVSVTSQPEEPVRVSASTLVCGDEGVLSGPDQIRKVPTSDVEERLTEVSLAVKALEGRVGTLVDRVGALVEDFQGRIEGTLQAFQGKGARQAEDLEKMAQDLGGRWSQQFQGQAEAAVERLREELKSSGRVVEEGKRQLASLAEAKLASLSQATREEYGQQLGQAFREHTQAMHEAADVEVESIKLAAEQAIAQLQVAEQKKETSFTAGAGAAEERLTGVSLALEALEGRVGALVEDFQGKGARQAEDLEKMAQDLGGRWSQQFQGQAEAAVERLQEELKSSGRVVEESKRQLASLAEAKLASLSQATREEYGQQLGQAFREHAQAMHEAADVEVKSIKLAAEQAIAQLQVAEQKRETSFTAGAGTAEECLTGVSLAVEALEGRVGALVEDFQGKGARQAEDLEKMAQDLGGRWSQQFQEQAEAAVERLQEELKSSGRVVEEGKRQLASLAEAKLASLSQATREEYGQQLGQAFREHTQAMHEAADVEVESIKLAAEQAIAQLQVAEQKKETSFTAGAGAAEERLTGVSLAVEALEGRVGALVEDFQGKGARQAEDLEKIAQDLGGRWSQQFQEQAEAAVERLREELKSSGRVVEEGKRQLASLAEAKLASLSQATREEYGQQLGQAFREHTQAMHEAADVEVESIKLAAEQAIAQLQVAEQKKETSFTAGAGAAEERLTGVSLALEALEGRVGALVEDFQGKGARQAEDLEKMAQDLGGRWSQQFQGQAEAAVERLQEELKSSGRVVEESKRQLASLAEAKLASLSQATREEYGQQLGQAFREHAQAMHEAADVEVKSIKLAAEQAIAQLQVAEQKRETSFTAGAGAAEECLTGVSLAVEALEGRVGALVEDFQGRIEGTLQAFQGEGTRQAKDLEKMAQDLGGRWSQQFEEQGKAAVERLREELKNSGRVVEEGKRQLASLAKAKLASLSQATREEYGQQLAQAFREHAQVMHEAADEEVESIKLAAEQAIAQLQAAEEKRETSFTARAGAAEECLTGVSLAVEALEGRLGALVEDFQGRIEGTLRAFQGQGARQAGDLERMAQDMGGRWSQQFEEQAGAAVERLREELKSSGRAVEESKRELASLAKAKLLALSKVADNAAAGLEAEQRRLKNQYETSRRELEDLLKRGWTKPPSLSLQRGNRPKRRRIVAQPALVAGVCLLIMVPLLSVYLPKAHVMQLQPEAPAEFIDQSPYWSAERRAREEEVAQAYWRAAVVGLQERYPFGSELPAEPPTEFQVENEYIAPGGAKAFFETRARYWENLRRSWVQPQFWVERPERNTQWAARLRQIWDHLHPPK